MGGRNDLCGFGTSFESTKWRSLDPCGLVCVTGSASVHIFSFIVLAEHMIEGSLLANFIFLLIYVPVTVMALSSLYMAWSSNPGAVPMGARPLVTVRRASSGEVTPTNSGNSRNRATRRCHKCNDNFKPTRAHHDAVTGRCIVKFDHYCPWVGNAVGAMNHKFFVLFIFYTVCACLLSLFLILLRTIRCGYVIGDSSDERLFNKLGHANATSAERNGASGYADPTSNIENYTDDNEDQHRKFFRMLSADYVHEECTGWHESYSVLILFIASIIFLIFTCCMLTEQIEAIQTNVNKIARMKMRVGQAGTELQRVTEEFNEMFGGEHKEVSWHWFLPLPVQFPRGMEKVVLGYEWDTTFDPVPYGLDEETGNAPAAPTATSEESKIELTTQSTEAASLSPKRERQHVAMIPQNNDQSSISSSASDSGVGLTKRSPSSASDEPMKGLMV